MSYEHEDTSLFEFEQKNLPKSAKSNLTKNGKRKPLSRLQVQNLYGKTLNFNSFQRTAQIYYKTSKSVYAKSVFLKNEVTLQACQIFFKPLQGNYIRIVRSKQVNGSTYYLELFLQRPKTNKDLFIKLIDLDLI